jgi:hypothetical protein
VAPDVRDSREQAKAFGVPEQAARDLERRCRTVGQYPYDVIAALAAVGIQAGGQHIHAGKGTAMAGEHSCRIQSDEARQAFKIVDETAPPLACFTNVQIRDGNDTTQQVIASE